MKIFFRCSFKHKQILTRVLQTSICLTLVGLFLDCKIEEKPENLKNKLIELCKVIPTDFREIRSPRSIIKLDRGTYSRGFSAKMTYLEVKDYYFQQLVNKGWEVREHSSYNVSTYDETKYINYRKDGYDIEIETSNLGNDDSEKVFFITCGWQAN